MNWKELSDRELVEACVRDNRNDAWVEFLSRFQPVIARAVTRKIRSWMIPDPSVVDDLVQSTLKKICDNDRRAIRDFRWLHENSFRGFLKVVSSNLVQDYFRKHPPIRREENLEEVEPSLPRRETFTRGVELEALADKLIKCLQSLLSAEQDCKRDLAMFLLYYRYGCTAKEISRLYPLTIKAVENTLLRMVRMAKARCLKQGQAGQA